MPEKQCFFTIKDHKQDFRSNPKYHWLLNPTKSDIGSLSKKILERINSELISITSGNQWRNSVSVIEWFKQIPDKALHSFIVFDTQEFYP